MSTVSLVKRVTTPAGRRFCPVVVSANGRISPEYVIVNGEKERYAGGTYYMEWWEGPARKRLAVGKEASQAQAQRLRKEAHLNAKTQGLALVDGEAKPRLLIGDATAEYIEETRLTKKPKTISAYSIALDYFQQSCDRKYMDEIERIDLLKFTAFLRDKKDQAPRSVYNKFENLMTFLKRYRITGLAGSQDWPKYVEEEPETYEPEDLDNLLKVCTKQEKLLYDFLLMTGVREQECIYMTWADINFQQSTVSVRWKEQYGWSPKGYKGREIPVPDKLIAALKSAKVHAPKNCQLVFPTSGCKPQTHMLRSLQRLAKRAGVDPGTVWLHKFRATFATRHLQNGVDIRTMQKWMGHVDLESTMRYLKPARNRDMRDKVNQTFV